MGCSSSTSGQSTSKLYQNSKTKPKRVDMDRSRLVVCADITKSKREEQNTVSFNAFCDALGQVGRALGVKAIDHLPGQKERFTTMLTSGAVFSLEGDRRKCKDFVNGVSWIPSLTVASGTPHVCAASEHFATLIERVAELAKNSDVYHVLLIVSDCQITQRAMVDMMKAAHEVSGCALYTILLCLETPPSAPLEAWVHTQLAEHPLENFCMVDYNRVMLDTLKRPGVTLASEVLTKAQTHCTAAKRSVSLREGKTTMGPKKKQSTVAVSPNDQSSSTSKKDARKFATALDSIIRSSIPTPGNVGSTRIETSETSTDHLGPPPLPPPLEEPPTPSSGCLSRQNSRGLDDDPVTLVSFGRESISPSDPSITFSCSQYFDKQLSSSDRMLVPPPVSWKGGSWKGASGSDRVAQQQK